MLRVAERTEALLRATQTLADTQFAMDRVGIGIACGKCDRLSPMGARSCSDCGQNLSLWLGIGPSVMADAPAGPLPKRLIN